MFPIKDQNPTRTFPFVNYLLIAVNLAAYVWQTLLVQQNGEVAVVAGYGLVATRLLTDPPGELFTIFTSMFMHGGCSSGGNLLFLHLRRQRRRFTGASPLHRFLPVVRIAAAAAQSSRS